MRMKGAHGKEGGICDNLQSSWCHLSGFLNVHFSTHLRLWAFWGHLIVLSRRQDHVGKPIRAAYEDVRKAPSAPLLAELDGIDFIFPRSYSVIDEDFEEGMFPPTSAPPPLFSELEYVLRGGDVMQLSRPERSAEQPEAENEVSLPDLGASSDLTEISEFRTEEAL